LLVGGPDPAGFDDPVLVALARHLAASGLTIVTPDISELARYELVPAITDAIEQAGRWLSSEATLAPGQTIGLMGVGMSGGFAVVAAGRASMAGRVAFVLTLGGHDDLPRVLKYLCTGVEPRPANQVRLRADTTQQDPTAFVRPPDSAAVAGLVVGLAHRLVPSGQVEPLRDTVRGFLAGQQGAAAGAPPETSRRLPEPSDTSLRYVYARDIAHLGMRMLPYPSAYGGDPALSPSRSPKPSAPVFLLNGADDYVIPPVEAEYLAEQLRGHAPIRLLINGFAFPSQSDRDIPAGDLLKLAGFWGDLLSR